MTIAALQNGSIGGSYDGTFQQYGVFEESWLVRLASNLSYLEGASLSDCGVTAWNALYGLKAVKPGEWVLTQGTGGVSLFAIQVRLVCLYHYSTEEKANTEASLRKQEVLGLSPQPHLPRNMTCLKALVLIILLIIMKINTGDKPLESLRSMAKDLITSSTSVVPTHYLRAYRQLGTRVSLR